MHRIAVVVGSLRNESINMQFARALEKLGEGTFAFDYVNLHEVPLYNEDLWQPPPAGVTRMKQQLEAADGILLITPEYNRSIPGVLKNAIDWASRPRGNNSWDGKPAAITGATGGNIGTAAAQAHLRSVAVTVGLIVMASPEVYFTSKPALFGGDYEIVDESTRKFLAGFMSAFDKWIQRVGE